MINKVIIGILVFLAIISGGLCFYAYTLSQQIDSLSVQLTGFHQEQAAQIGAVSNELMDLGVKTLVRHGILEGEIGEAISRLDILEDELDTLEDEVGGVATKFSQSLINANEIYQRARQAIVRVSDGERTIGSGFIIDAYVVTAYHVTEKLSNIYVILPDGSISLAFVTGSCQYSDITVLTLEDELLIEPLVLADSATVRIGEPVVAIGSPFDLTETLTSGIVSQTNRSTDIEYDQQTRWVANLIQFDAPVNSGNSGSPLLNSEGEVIGMVIARIKPDEGDGIYYAISSNKIRRVVASLIEQGSFDYPWLGVEIANLTPQTVRDRELETANGALVKKVLTDSPAEAAGIKVDDIIVAIDEMAIRDVADLTSYLGEHKSPDEVVTLTLIRETAKLELSLEIGKRGSLQNKLVL